MTATGGGDDDGTAVVEFVLLAVVLIVPFVYAVLCVFEVERAAFAATAATREAGRSFVTAPDGTSGVRRAGAAASVLLDDHGLSPHDLRIDCEQSPCLSPGSRVSVELTVEVPLPFVPTLGHRSPAAVRVHARHVEVVDTFREVRR